MQTHVECSITSSQEWSCSCSQHSIKTLHLFESHLETNQYAGVVFRIKQIQVPRYCLWALSTGEMNSRYLKYNCIINFGCMLEVASLDHMVQYWKVSQRLDDEDTSPSNLLLQAWSCRAAQFAAIDATLGSPAFLTNKNLFTSCIGCRLTGQ